ncbi:Gfo/Idh/MocA family oxidoreductase [Pseudarthrobacter sp. J75]|uniref:Gfo/Idh/MocA family protein n=1 Tax=unclassified Pseudarthrobacter TaxID=2647000 RepID=UPI002E7FFDF2|nr:MULTISPECIES: Gfo/Idh/MocA family oxidoreductase [unclassified Pseudarthrobacter]MEE2524235.1 Gfo/Idh/MocA family oxidoreductase [Pseudarthrobacter sp. J47]MEE2530168.1 Gfo/Idh/MocA family oxidoreductase [Pseudarthrobacter sp. J75]
MNPPQLPGNAAGAQQAATQAANAHSGTTKKVRAGIIGTGGIAAAHAQALAEGGAELVVAVDIDPSRAKDFAVTWGIAATAASLEEAARLGLDVVAICTPPSSHALLAKEALALGLNAVVEKPPALSLRELKELQEAEAASGKSVSCIFQHRFGGAAQKLERLQRSGALGKPLTGYCNTLWFRDQAYFDVPWRGQWDVEGGGPTMGHGIHQFDLLLHLWGPWQEVTAFAGRLARRTETEDVSMAVVRFGSGALSTVINSVISPRETSQLRFDYENATVEVEHLYGYDDSHWRFTPAPGMEHLQELWDADTSEGTSGHAAQYRRILAAPTTEAPRAPGKPPVTLSDAYATMELAAGIYSSAITGQTVRSGSITEGNPFFDRADGRLEPWKLETSNA